jgi:acetylornithine deacetylase/succinyl-diaminopimelate desuccinylase-like protein
LDTGTTLGLKKIPQFVEKIESIREIIISNIVLLGQVPSPTFKEASRAKAFLERLIDSQVDEATGDAYNNPIGIIRGTSASKPPIFLVAHLDTFFDREVLYNFTVSRDAIEGPGLLDNSLGVAILASMPEIFRALDLRFQSDIVLAGVTQSLGRGNLSGIRHLLKTWATPIRAAISIEGVELGRLNYYSDGMIRCEIECIVHGTTKFAERNRPNAILILNELINQILEIGVPQRPRSRIVIGRVTAGVTHGRLAQQGSIGLEIHSHSMKMVKVLFREVGDIISGLNQEFDATLTMDIVSSLHAARLKFNHPLVKAAVAVMKTLGLRPVSEASESELSIMLARGIPAVTLGITHGDNKYQEKARAQITPMYKGIAQIVGVIAAIDNGVCDD